MKLRLRDRKGKGEAHASGRKVDTITRHVYLPALLTHASHSPSVRAAYLLGSLHDLLSTFLPTPSQ
jgi:hypothetical protein